MYKEFFGLTDTPFTLTPDPRFIVFTPSYNEVLASLYYGLENAKGLIVMTGEVGTGKTTALRWILRRLDSSVLAAYVFNPRLSIDDFYHHVTQMLGIKEWTNKSELLNTLGRVLEERHRRGLRTVIIIDEAHELSDYVLEEIRLLLNFESDNAKHLQIVLTGQTELREKLNQKNLRQLKQRVALRCSMHSFPNVDEVDRYITERLLIAGSDQPNIFTPGAVDYIFRCSEGIPRQINNICDNALLAAYSAGEQVISRQIIEAVAENLDMLPSRDAFTDLVGRAAPPSGSVVQPEAENDMFMVTKTGESTDDREESNTGSDEAYPPMIETIRENPDMVSNNGGVADPANYVAPRWPFVQPEAESEILTTTESHEISDGQQESNSIPSTNGTSNGHTNGHSNVDEKQFKKLDVDEVALEIEELISSFRRLNQ